MKLLSIFLAAYLGFLSTHVVMVKVETAEATPVENICVETCTENKPMDCCGQESSSREERTCYPKDCNRPCPPCVCGIYCFCCVLQTPYTSPAATETSFKLNTTEGLALVSNYHVDYFRPPETV